MDSEKRDITCSFTGHRPGKLPWGNDENAPEAVRVKEKLRDYIRLLAQQKGVRRFISGMAPGIDMYAAEAVIELKKEQEGISLDDSLQHRQYIIVIHTRQGSRRVKKPDH